MISRSAFIGQCLLAALLAIGVFWTPAPPTFAEQREAAMDRFLEAIAPGKKFDAREVLRAAACFQPGVPATGLARVLNQAHQKIVSPGGKFTYYIFFPSASRGEEGDYALDVVVIEGCPPVIKECYGGVLCR